MIFFTPVVAKHMKKNLDIKKPHYSEKISGLSIRAFGLMGY